VRWRKERDERETLLNQDVGKHNRICSLADNGLTLDRGKKKNKGGSRRTNNKKRSGKALVNAGAEARKGQTRELESHGTKRKGAQGEDVQRRKQERGSRDKRRKTMKGEGT